MNTWVIGDIHGGLRALTQLLARPEIGTHDRLVFLGDYVDGWSQNSDTIEYLIELQAKRTIITLKGNHDDLCRKWLETKKTNPLWLGHGGAATVKDYTEKADNALEQKHLAFFNNLPTHWIDDQNRLFVHAGFTHVKGVEQEYFSDLLFWDRSLWELALAVKFRLTPEDADYPQRLLQYREIYIGHTPVTRIGYTEPVRAANVWNVDTGAAFRGPLTAFCVETQSWIQSDPVYQFYPGEIGRN